MNTETKVLHIRRATVLDAVNIFRLIVDEEKRAQARVKLDDATRLMDVVTTISTGYASVAEISGRIVGAIGALPSDTTGEVVLVGTFFALSPSFRDTPVGDNLVSGLLRAAGEADMAVKFVLPVDMPLREYLAENGFEIKAVVWGRAADEAVIEGEPSDDAPDAENAVEAADESDDDDEPDPALADDPRLDEVLGAADSDGESAMPDFAATRPAPRRNRKERAA